MKNSYRFFLVLTCIFWGLILSFLIAFALIWNYVPTSNPKEWERISVGMTRLEVYSILGIRVRRLSPGEDFLWLMGPKREWYWEGPATYSKYRSKNIWKMALEFDGGSGQTSKTIEEYNENLDNKLVHIRFWQDQEAFFLWFPFPRIVEQYHS